MHEDFHDHPSNEIVGTKGESLKGKTICVCVTGSVAAVNTPNLCRELMRLGADVYVVMSHAATQLIHPNLLHWATGNKVITELTGDIEHITLAGERPNNKGKADLILVAPATANTISKIASGIDDTPVTTVVTTAFGSKTPIIIVPAMHESMYNHPILNENIEKLKKFGVKFVLPRVIESKAKIAETQEIVNFIVNILNPNKDCKGLNFIVTTGPGREYIDRVRFISNPSSGKMGMEIAAEIISRGGNVALVNGQSTASVPIGVEEKTVESAQDYINVVSQLIQERKYTFLISAAAIADFTPSKKFDEKISSSMKILSLELTATPKLIEIARKLDPSLFIVAFKAESDLTPEKLVDKAYHRLQDSNANLIVANDVYHHKGITGFQSETNEVFIIDREKHIDHIELTSKRQCASKIIDKVLVNYQRI
jgi:phosphopantothenoylcysteine decarboxylase/phosphopantothenate--cysteine ligase